MLIQGREIGAQHRPFIIAEVAQTHDGSLGTALAFIDVAKECGADAIKFQTHIASEESTPSEPWRVPFSKQDASRFDYWRRMEFTREQWGIIKSHADRAGIIFLSSPFSLLACEWLAELDMPAWKIASGEVHNRQLLDFVANTGRPTILSSGLSTLDESRARVQDFRQRGQAVALLHCTTRYPTPADEVGMNVLEDFVREFPDLPVGLSDHSGEVFPGVVAAYAGASLIEVHLTMHRRMFGPDVSSSLLPEQLKELVRGAEFAWRMRSIRIDKDTQLGRLAKERTMFGRSLVFNCDLEAGTVLREEHFGYKKPGGGILYEERTRFVGGVLAAAVKKDEMLKVEHVQ